MSDFEKTTNENGNAAFTLPYDENTKLSVILEDYPWLSRELPKMDERLKIVGSPFGKALAGRMTLADAAKRAGYPVETILEKLTEVIAAYEQRTE